MVGLNRAFQWHKMADNDIDNSGAYNLSEALKTNTTLTELDLSCEDKRKNTQKDIHQQITLFIIITLQTTFSETQEQHR